MLSCKHLERCIVGPRCIHAAVAESVACKTANNHQKLLKQPCYSTIIQMNCINKNTFNLPSSTALLHLRLINTKDFLNLWIQLGEKSKNPITQSVMLPLVRPFGFQSKMLSPQKQAMQMKTKWQNHKLLSHFILKCKLTLSLSVKSIHHTFSLPHN